MLKEILDAWKGDDVMESVLKRLGRMVSDATYVCENAWEVCIGQAVSEKMKSPLKERDKEVNRGEREVRSMVARHLSLNPGKDVAGCLAVMVMAKDIERIGDHGCSIYRIGARTEGAIPTYRFFGQMEAAYKQVTEPLNDLEHAILESDDKLARSILTRYQAAKQSMKGLEASLYTANLAGTEAIATTLLTRAIWRLNSHIGNVTSGIVFPLENIDFVSRGLKGEED